MYVNDWIYMNYVKLFRCSQAGMKQGFCGARTDEDFFPVPVLVFRDSEIPLNI